MTVAYIIWKVEDALVRLRDIYPQASLDHFIIEYSKCVQTPAGSLPHPYKPDWRVFCSEKVGVP